ncbi:hypothetical protein DVA67_030825 [Solirubrobacter sp. CPCC 204708]|uniref:Uncharacterized protein n=1 Tax=Solirubrobacter deserti TaxID=2282478 RepID=A0ABT4RLG4_9ACTN|nr:hypothetical protein [Solirubrobacter deserti]MBE2320398.1 hypothetical protein [Solirubrobacter deserti]MDA0139407.1 hypothetical protein [Solirubrobacter deserti]
MRLLAQQETGRQQGRVVVVRERVRIGERIGSGVLTPDSTASRLPTEMATDRPRPVASDIGEIVPTP